MCVCVFSRPSPASVSFYSGPGWALRRLSWTLWPALFSKKLLLILVSMYLHPKYSGLNGATPPKIRPHQIPGTLNATLFGEKKKVFADVIKLRILN